MIDLSLTVSLRSEFGKQASKKLRKNGQLPCVLYGKQKHRKLYVQELDFNKILKGHSSLGNMVFSLVFENKKDNSHAVIQEIQKEPLSEKILHIDFKEISLKEEVSVKIPLVLKGTPVGVQMGGLIQQHLREISVRCLPENLVDSYDVDVEHLEIGKFVHVSDLSDKPGITIIQSPEDLILAVVAARVEESETSDEEEIKEPEVIGEKKEEDNE